MKIFKLLLFVLLLGRVYAQTDHYLGEIRLTSFETVPAGWALCNGQLLPINQNQPLFSLLGTTFGGDGRTNFALPNLMGRSILGAGSEFVLGQKGGEHSHTLTLQELPQHVHLVTGSITLPISTAPATLAVPTGNYLAVQIEKSYADAASNNAIGCQFSHAVITNGVGGSQPHNNMQPYLVMNYIIALTGIFPSQN